MIDLPKGYTVKEDRIVGFIFYDETGNIVTQHPVDSDTIRRALYCLCVEPTSHSSGLMADGSFPIICQACNKEMFIEGIHQIVESSYVISLLEREKKFIEYGIEEAREKMEWNGMLIVLKRAKDGLKIKKKGLKK